MTSEEGWKNKIRTSSTKEVAGTLRGAIEAKDVAYNGSRCRRQNKTKHRRSSTKARNTIKRKAGTKTRN